MTVGRTVRVGDQVLDSRPRVEGYTAQIGDVQNGNYLQVEADGTIRLIGTAGVWDDWQGPLVSNQAANPSAHITIDTAEAALKFKTNCDTGDYVYMVVQMPHGWEPGSSLHPHIHWWQTTAAIPHWVAQYRWQRNGNPKTTSWTNWPLTTNAYTYTTGTLCQITEGSEAGITPPSGYGFSDLVQFRILRDVANALGLFGGAESSPIDTYAVNFDVHFHKNAIGSREEFSQE